MSRLGKKPIPVPASVKVAVDGRKITVSSGQNSLELVHRPEIAVAWDQEARELGVSVAQPEVNTPEVRAYWGMTRALLQNMVTGVTQGFQKQLEVVGVGYSAEVAGPRLNLKLGFANTISVPIPPGVTVSVEKQLITVKGADRRAVGQFAADVRAKRKPEPYNGKGVKYIDEVITRKQGKAFGTA